MHCELNELPIKKKKKKEEEEKFYLNFVLTLAVKEKEKVKKEKRKNAWALFWNKFGGLYFDSNKFLLFFFLFFI